MKQKYRNYTHGDKKKLNEDIFITGRSFFATEKGKKIL